MPAPDPLVARYQGQSFPPPLAGIDRIDWSSLQHAYGSAADVPALLSAALSADPQDRADGFDLLFGTIWHQGTVYQASAYAVPFLYNALEWTETPDKLGFVSLLSCIADGHSYLHVHALYGSDMQRIWREMLAREGRVLDNEIDRELEHVRLARQAVGERLYLLYPYLPDEPVSCDVARALGLYPERRSETVPLLQAAQSVVTDEYCLEEIRASLAKLAEPGALA